MAVVLLFVLSFLYLDSNCIRYAFHFYYLVYSWLISKILKYSKYIFIYTSTGIDGDLNYNMYNDIT